MAESYVLVVESYVLVVESYVLLVEISETSGFAQRANR